MNKNLSLYNEMNPTPSNPINNMGNSYMYREPMMDYSMMGGYSGAKAKEDIMKELKNMMSEAIDDKTRTTISEIINRIK